MGEFERYGVEASGVRVSGFFRVIGIGESLCERRCLVCDTWSSDTTAVLLLLGEKAAGIWRAISV